MDFVLDMTWSGLMPRSMCLRFNPVLIGIYLVFNSLIGLCYLRMPLLAFWRARQAGARFNKTASDFGKFIFWCGIKHLGDCLLILVGSFYMVEIFLILPFKALYSIRANRRFSELLPALTASSVAFHTAMRKLEQEVKASGDQDLEKALRDAQTAIRQAGRVTIIEEGQNA